jgi:two-component system chemotaxis response regulator CheB
MSHRDIIVIGASAGGLEALKQVVKGLNSDLDAAVFVVIHTGAGSAGILPEILERAGPWPAGYPADGESIISQRIYVAPPDYHLLIARDIVRITKGPKENGFRPAVDPLFRTAAEGYGPRVIGIILSGGQSDGTVGLAQIKDAGGLTVVQNPEDALVPAMPENAIRYVDVDHVVNAADIPALILSQRVDAVKKPTPTRRSKPDSAEVGTDRLHSAAGPPGEPSAFVCPECGGPLWELNERGLLRFRCHVGHAYTGESLVEAQAVALEQALWTALRSLEEGAELRQRMARHAREHRMFAIAKGYSDQAREMEERAAVVRRALVVDRFTGGEGEPAAEIAERARQAVKD